jgi:hypothetical protein
MRSLLRAAAAALFVVAGGAPAEPVAGSATRAVAPSWDVAAVGRTIDAARQARQRGDLMAAERLCHAAFRAVDESALAAYDAYAERLEAEHRGEAATVRAQAARLHEVKAQQAGTQPTSTYLGFSTAGGLQAYADLLRGLGDGDQAERMRSLALAYQQVQQAQFQRTQLFQQGRDPRGAC